MSGDLEVDAGAGEAPAIAMLSSPNQAHRMGEGDPRLDVIDRWRVALSQHDDDEVDRLVRQSRADRVEGATSGRLGLMLGLAVSSAPSEVIP